MSFSLSLYFPPSPLSEDPSISIYRVTPYVWMHHTLFNQSSVAGHLSYIILYDYKPFCNNLIILHIWSYIYRNYFQKQDYWIKGLNEFIILLNIIRVPQKALCQFVLPSISSVCVPAAHSLGNKIVCVTGKVQPFNLGKWAFIFRQDLTVIHRNLPHTLRELNFQTIKNKENYDKI